MPGRIDGQSHSDRTADSMLNVLEKRERPGYEWGPRWGADGSSSPAFAWGQALGLGGGDCQRNDRLKQSSCLEKTAINLTGRRKFFSLSATSCTPEVLNWAIFREDKPLLQLAMGRWMRSRIVRISTPVQLAGCRARTALARVESERCDRATLRHCEIDRQLTIENRESNLVSRARRTVMHEDARKYRRRKSIARDGWLRGDGACVTS